ncbi:MAG: hypothetical protein JNK98_01320 [Chitinophagaceae bacterium]|nr:hypothetical protein [Chitinophagaceae bacterium]
MLRFVLASIVIVSAMLLSCKSEQGKKNLLPSLAESDSAIVMYYHTPGNPRFFNMTKVYDKAFITRFSEIVNKKTTEVKENCTTQGKIYFYVKKGAVETIYFSRADSCMTLSFIKTGEKYFVKLSKELKLSLDELEKKNLTLPAAGE